MLWILGMKSPNYEAAGYDTGLADAEWEFIEPLLYPAGYQTWTRATT
jgi:hypothetical protein